MLSTPTSQQKAIANRSLTYKKLQYIPGLTTKIKMLFQDRVSIAYTSANPVNKFFTPLKDRVKLINNSNVVYLLQCNDCKHFYVGQTQQRVRERNVQHISDSRRKPKACKLAAHISTTHHTVDFNNTIILFKERTLLRRLFLETLGINIFQPSLNAKTDSDNFSNIYKYKQKIT